MGIRNIEIGTVHHVFSKSIAGFKIFEFESCQNHFQRLLRFYSMLETPGKLSHFLDNKTILKEYGDYDRAIYEFANSRDKLVNIVAYCIMPTHIHLILEQIHHKGIENFMGNILNAYTRYYNSKIKRAGPLWQSKYKNVLIETDEQLLHVSRYIHLNPTTSNLCIHPRNWDASSFNEYQKLLHVPYTICNFRHLINLSPSSYLEFTENQIDYQRSLATLKKLTLE